MRKPASSSEINRNANPQATEEQVRARAYELFEARGRAGGHDLEDWMQAEKELAAGRRGAAIAA